jgi:hypothetical protein
LALALTLAVALYFYVRKLGEAGPVEFSTTVSVLIVIAVALSLVWILVLTIRGKLIGRRPVFVYVGIAVALPLFMNLSQRFTTSPEVAALHQDLIELPKGSKVLLSFDYDPPTAPELQPMAESIIRLCFLRDLRVIIMGLWPQGPQQANLALERVLEDPEVLAKKVQYGVDYVNLGFQTGNEFVIQRMGTSFESMFRTDFLGTPYQELPLVKNIRNFSNVDYSVNLSAGFPGTVEWIQVAVDRYGVRLGAGNTAVQSPLMYTYLNTGQLRGLLGGMSGAAEFEEIAEHPGKGAKYMLAQSFAHVVVIAFVVIGNVAFFLGRRKTSQTDEGGN